VFSVGAIVGMVIISILPQRVKLYHKLFNIGLIVLSLISLLYGLPIIPFFQTHLDNNIIFIFFCVISFIRSIFDSFVLISIMTIFQKRVSDEYRGRFFGLQNTVFISLKPLGFVIVGFLTGIIEAYIIVLFLSLLFIILSIFVLLSSDFRELFNVAE
jgi:MFS transporter, DHA3 family, macrolide efflux protein